MLLNHLSHEERDLEPISAAYQDAPPMKAALKQVKKAHLKSMGNFVEWLQDGADAAEHRRNAQGTPASGHLPVRQDRRPPLPTRDRSNLETHRANWFRARQLTHEGPRDPGVALTDPIRLARIHRSVTGFGVP